LAVVPESYYDVLGVARTAESGEIKAQYRKLIQRIHPDRDGPPAVFLQVQEAYEVLADPARRAAYDRSLVAPKQSAGDSPVDANASSRERAASRRDSRGRARRSSAAASTRSPRRPERKTGRSLVRPLFLDHYVAFAVALVGAYVLIVGFELGGGLGLGLIALGVVAIILAGVARFGGRGTREREAYRRSGMAAVDVMNGRQFEVLLEHFFADKGYRVARLGGRGEFGANLLLDSAEGRTIVEVRRWSGLVHHDAVQRAVLAMDRYGATRALVVTSSNYSDRAVADAEAHGVTLWDRAALAAELSALRAPALESGVQRFSSDFRAGARIFLGFVATTLAASAAAGRRARAQQQANRAAS
jgi:restriction system protein